MFLLGAIVSLCYVPGFIGSSIATQWPVLSIVLPALFLWRSGPVTVFHWMGLLFLTYAAARLWYVPIFEDGVFGLWLVSIMGLSFWLGSTMNSMRGLYAGLAVGAAVSSAVAVFQLFGYSGIPFTGFPAGLFYNSVAQGLVLSLVAVALISERMWLWTLPLLPGLVLCGSKGAWIALAVGVAGSYVRGVWIFAALIVGALFFLVHPLSSSDALRVSVWYATALNLTTYGWGPGSFFSWGLWQNGSILYPEYAHNDALQLVFEYGPAAVLPLALFGFALTRTAEREWPLIAAFAVASCYSMPLFGVPVASFMVCAATGRVVRGWALARVERDGSRPHVLPGRRRANHASGEFVSLVPHS